MGHIALPPPASLRSAGGRGHPVWHAKLAKKTAKRDHRIFFRNFPSLTKPGVVVSNQISPKIRAVCRLSPTGNRKPEVNATRLPPARVLTSQTWHFSTKIENHHFATSLSRAFLVFSLTDSERSDKPLLSNVYITRQSNKLTYVRHMPNNV